MEDIFYQRTKDFVSNCNSAEDSKHNKVQKNCYAKSGISTIEVAIKQLGMRAELNTLIAFCMPVEWYLSTEGAR
jgi:hypothetical protein